MYGKVYNEVLAGGKNFNIEPEQASDKTRGQKQGGSSSYETPLVDSGEDIGPWGRRHQTGYLTGRSIILPRENNWCRQQPSAHRQCGHIVTREDRNIPIGTPLDVLSMPIMGDVNFRVGKMPHYQKLPKTEQCLSLAKICNIEGLV